MKKFEVLGTGCRKCVQSAQDIATVAKELGLEVDVEKVTDPQRIMEYGVMSTPAVALDGRVVHTGSVPGRDQIEAWLTEPVAG